MAGIATTELCGVLFRLFRTLLAVATKTGGHTVLGMEGHESTKVVAFLGARLRVAVAAADIAAFTGFGFLVVASYAADCLVGGMLKKDIHFAVFRCLYGDGLENLMR